MTWIVIGSVTATNNSTDVVVNSSTDLTAVPVSDALQILGFDLQEIKEIRRDPTASKDIIVLTRPWHDATQTSVPARIVPTSGDFQDAARLMRLVSKDGEIGLTSLRDFVTSTADNLTVTTADGTVHTIPTLDFITREVRHLTDEANGIIGEVRRLAAETSGHATDASDSKTASANSATAALASENKSEEWATKPLNSPVETGPDKFSSLHWATISEQEAQKSAASAGEAKTSENAAHASEMDASDHKDKAKASENKAKASENKAKIDADRAQNALTVLSGALIENGSVDLSSGTPPPPLENPPGTKLSTFWKVTVAGTVNGENYGVGDSIVYSAQTTHYYKIDNTESVTSVDGLKGVVSLVSRYVSRTANQTISGIKTWSGAAIFNASVTFNGALKMGRGSGVYSDPIQMQGQGLLGEIRNTSTSIEFVNRTNPAVASSVNLIGDGHPTANSHLTRKDWVESQIAGVIGTGGVLSNLNNWKVATVYTDGSASKYANAKIVLDAYNAAVVIANSKLNETAADGKYLGKTAKAASAVTADKVGNLAASSFLRSDANDIKTSGYTRYNDGTQLQFGAGDLVHLMQGTDYNLVMNSGASNIKIKAGVATRFTFTKTGNLTASGNVGGYSDIRLKANIVKIPKALDKVNSLGGYTFTRTDKAMLGKRQTGLIAQELEKVLPEAVIEDENGIKAVAYGNTVGLLVEAIKELSDKVNTLEKQLESK